MTTQSKKQNTKTNNWQTIVDFAYDKFYDYGDSYEDMVKGVLKEYGEVVALAVLLGKFNQQTCNGGLELYQFNGYAGSDKSFGPYSGDKVSMPLHNLLIKLFKKHFSYNNKTTRELLSILKSFQPTWEAEMESCYDCDGSGDFYDDELNEIDGDYDTCDGSGEVKSSNLYLSNYPSLNELDKRYYKISPEIMKLGEKFFSKAIKKIELLEVA